MLPLRLQHTVFQVIITGIKSIHQRSCKHARNVTLQDEALPGFDNVAVTLWTTVLVLLSPLQHPQTCYKLLLQCLHQRHRRHRTEIIGKTGTAASQNWS